MNFVRLFIIPVFGLSRQCSASTTKCGLLSFLLFPSPSCSHFVSFDSTELVVNNSHFVVHDCIFQAIASPASVSMVVSAAPTAAPAAGLGGKLPVIDMSPVSDVTMDDDERRLAVMDQTGFFPQMEQVNSRIRFVRQLRIFLVRHLRIFLVRQNLTTNGAGEFTSILYFFAHKILYSRNMSYKSCNFWKNLENQNFRFISS